MLKCSCWVFFFSFCRGWAGPAYLCVFVLKCFAAGRVAAGIDSALGPLTVSCAEGMLFLPALWCSKLSRGRCKYTVVESLVFQ